MSDFAVKIEGGYATATHHASGHVFEFSIASGPPYLRGGTVRENEKAERGPDSLWGAAQEAVLKKAQAAGLISEWNGPAGESGTGSG
jgi:hypothetical protein